MAQPKLSTLGLVAGPPAAVMTTIVVFKPEVLTWPMVIMLSIVFGAFGALAHTVLDQKEV